MAHGRTLVRVDGMVSRPPIGSTPKEYREVCNTLVDEQGWVFIEGMGGRKHKLIPPDPEANICLVPNTPSDAYFGFTRWVAQLRRSGAQIDENGNSTLVLDKPRNVAVSFEDALAAITTEDIAPISTRGQWWRAEPEPEPTPQPAPAPAPAPARVLRVVEEHDRKGAAYSLGQARDMIRQGYHINRVVTKTGWGRNWFSDLVDDTGYLALT